MKLKDRGNRLKSFIILLAIGVLFGMRAANSSCPELLNHEFPKLQDDTPQNLCMYENSVVLVVNTASFCGFTKQYEGLENLYKKYKSKGLVVLGFLQEISGIKNILPIRKLLSFAKTHMGEVSNVCQI